jgi:uncharacterized hydrophobic protein (TIGR00271 family)
MHDDSAEIFTDAADAATNAGLAYWLVLGLAGAIAALGLALNSSAVIIGAMLIAPLLAPVVGLGLALAIGDGRLALEVASIVVVSTLAVILVGALLALALPLPFQTVTTEIAARTRPTTLDLVIAVASGLAGAVVTVARRSRLSGAVPGVAVAVALVPPLAVTGYGIGTGWNWPIIRGSLLLYGANLAGIVMSGMVVFLVAGMHGPKVLAVVEDWHRGRTMPPLTNWIERTPGLRSLGIMRSTWTRVTLVVAFVALVGIPLRESLRQIARETRVRRAIDDASRLFEKPGRSFVISKEVDLGSEGSRVVLNVATTGWFSDSLQHLFEQRASGAAGEPISLVLDQLPASSGGDLSNLADLLSVAKPAVATPAAPPPTPAARIAALRATVGEAIAQVTVPDSVYIVDYGFLIGDSTSGNAVRMLYSAPRPLAPPVAQMIERQLARSLGLPRLAMQPEMLSTRPVAIRPRDIALIDSLATLARQHARLYLQLTAGPRARARDVDSLAALFRRASGTSESTAVVVVRSPSAGAGITARVLAR